jgi:hypothetical protein
MLRAVAIYELSEEDQQFKLVKFAKARQGFFAANDLETFEAKTLPEITRDLSAEKLYNKKIDDGFHYASWTPETRHLHVAISSRELTELAPYYLLINVRHVDERGEKLRATLDDIRLNYIGYIEHDILIKGTQDQLAAVRAQLLKNMEAALRRGELLENLEAKTEDLTESSKKFKLQATELKNSYTCCGGVKSALTFK